MEELVHKKCTPCEGGTPPLTEAEVQTYLTELGEGWSVIDNKKIRKEFTFKDFKEALVFVNNVGEIAEAEGHHPDIHLTDYKHAAIELSTHATGGLSENDFIVAAKIDALEI